MASFRAVRRTLCAAAEAAAAPVSRSRWEKLKSSKAGVWCRGLVSDYKEACREMLVGAWQRPIKASLYGTLLGGAYLCFHTKPDLASFEADLLERSNRLGLLSPWIRSGTSDGHVQNLARLRNEGRLRHASLGVLSLVYSADHDPDATLYEARCPDLAPPWRELPQRLLDVGFAGRWWVLDAKMRDYDVNEAEFRHLPAHMQATSPPGVQEVETNERLHRESWLPPTVEDEEETNVKKESQVRTIQAAGEEQQTEPWRELPQRLLDVGFAGRWWVLDAKMRDYDVNEAEFRHLPAHMQATSPPGVQEVETNERLHRESWLPPTVEDEEETNVKKESQVRTIQAAGEEQQTEA